jgi:PIN domain nuclease of toxin-antitoxin system
VRFLLDTNAFIWWTNEPEKLSQTALAICEDESNTLLLSIASIWEMQIKVQLGKLQLKHSLQSVIERHERGNKLTLLPIESRHIWALGHLPPHHKDPFDRILIAQSQIEAIPVITADPQFARYQVATIAAH